MKKIHKKTANTSKANAPEEISAKIKKDKIKDAQNSKGKSNIKLLKK
ncbi:MAG: hypothetical protein KC483_06965 [Nitrosarchaeum sp.]|nr:hypothetical protein [Nitrosarchaeum sp.]